MAKLRAVAAGTPVPHYFDGLELLEPGLTAVQEWRQDAATPTRLKIAGAVGRRP